MVFAKEPLLKSSLNLQIQKNPNFNRPTIIWFMYFPIDLLPTKVNLSTWMFTSQIDTLWKQLSVSYFRYKRNINKTFLTLTIKNLVNKEEQKKIQKENLFWYSSASVLLKNFFLLVQLKIIFFCVCSRDRMKNHDSDNADCRNVRMDPP